MQHHSFRRLVFLCEERRRCYLHSGKDGSSSHWTTGYSSCSRLLPRCGVVLWREGSEESLRNEGVLLEEVVHIHPYTFNDLESVVKAADDAGQDFAGIIVAGIIVAAFKWDWGRPHEAATAEFLRGVRALCDERGAALICDDVRSSFRINVGGTWADERYGHGVSPDISCLCKGIANGEAVSAMVGTSKWREGADKVVAMGSFWANAVPFAAALATPGSRCLYTAASEQLRKGLQEQAEAAGLRGFSQSGPPQMMFFCFDEELPLPCSQRRLIMRFCELCVAQGVIFHPHHTMFLSAAHTPEDIEAAPAVAKVAFEQLAAEALAR